MAPVLQHHALDPHELEVGLVHQSGGVQQRQGLVLPQPGAGQAPQVGVQQLKDLIGCPAVTPSCVAQQGSDVVGHGRSGRSDGAAVSFSGAAAP